MLFYMEPEKGSQSLYVVAMELGWIIVIPLIVFILIGRWLDGVLSTSPFLTLAFMGCAALVSSVAVFKKVSRMME